MANSTAPPPPIRLTAIGENQQYDRETLRLELRSRIGRAAILAATSNERLLRLARQHFERETAADDVFCANVLSRFEIESEQRTEVDRFVLKVLGFATLPSRERSMLLDEAVRYLCEVEKLIAHYEGLPAVVSSIAGSRPRDQEAGMYVAFYDRCLRERAAISRYMTQAVDAEAIRRADEHAAVRRLLLGYVPLPPDQLKSPRGLERLDWRRINRWRHRIRALPIRRGLELGALYAKDRTEFYRALAVERPHEQLFEGIEFAAQQLERLATRRRIFEELRTLFEARHWMGFYALALPQVEGLFAEMGELAAPKQNKSLSALPEKVRFIRSYACVHEQNLDYFEWLLPVERNRFSHSGRVNDPQLRALEILHDLSYVCEVYTELDSPVVELSRLLRGDEPRKLEHWARIFDVAEMVEKSAQLPEVEERLRALVVQSLSNDESTIATSLEIGTELPKSARQAGEKLRAAAFAQLGIEVDVEGQKKSPELLSRCTEIADIIEELRDADSSFDFPFLLRSLARGFLRYLDLPARSAAREALTAGLAQSHRTLSNFESISAMAASRRGSNQSGGA